MIRRLARVCKLPLSLWLLSASWPPTSCARASHQFLSGRSLFFTQVWRVLNKSFLLTVPEPGEPVVFLTCEQRHGNLRSGYNPCLSGLTAPPGCCAGTPTNGCFRWSNRPGDSSLGSIANLSPHGNLSPIGLCLEGFGSETPGLLWSAVYP